MPNTPKNIPFIERFLEQALFASRWLLAPFYIGLSLALFLLIAVFCKELWHFFGLFPDIDGGQTILAALSLIDLTLAGNLIIIVVFSGYESFVSKFDITPHKDQPAWQSKVDFATLKIKLIASIVAISSIHLLKVFMDIAAYQPAQIKWLVIIHCVFFLSGVALAATDKLAASAKAKKE
jgi:uncharacterized protein (TIGR00645 family)